MFSEVERSAALRRPQGGTPQPQSLEEPEATELIGDVELLWLAMQSPGHEVLCGVLLRAQIQNYKRRRHIISYSDEYTMRRIRNAGSTGRLPNIYCRCLRCGCIAHLLDWCVVVDVAPDYMRPFGTRIQRPRITPSDEFLRPCTGNDKAEEAQIFLNLND